jgi:hypothetical protein
MMDSAARAISDSLTSLASTLGKTLNIDLLTKFNVGLNVTFTQPTSWYKSQQEDKTTAASAIGAFLMIFVVFAGAASVLGHFKPKFVPNNDPPPMDKKAQMQAFLDREEERVRESTKPFTFKFRGGAAQLEQEGGPLANQVLSSEAEGQRENSMFASDDTSQRSGSKKENPSGLGALFACFSIPKNLYALAAPRRRDIEHPGLDTLEGIKVLTMCWGILTATALYALSAPVRNLYVMLDLFKQYLFACIASGNLAPDLFLFMIHFLGFVKICRLYDARSGIGVIGYAQLYLQRFLRLAPLYYLVFFAGWFIVPLLSNSANWYVAERLFWNCSSQWPYVLLFVNNLAPFFTKALEG